MSDIQNESVDIKDLFEIALDKGQLKVQVDLFGLAKMLAEKTDNKLDDAGVGIAVSLLENVKISSKDGFSSGK